MDDTQLIAAECSSSLLGTPPLITRSMPYSRCERHRVGPRRAGHTRRVPVADHCRPDSDSNFSLTRAGATILWSAPAHWLRRGTDGRRLIPYCSNWLRPVQVSVVEHTTESRGERRTSAPTDFDSTLPGSQYLPGRLPLRYSTSTIRHHQFEATQAVPAVLRRAPAAKLMISPALPVLWCARACHRLPCSESWTMMGQRRQWWYCCNARPCTAAGTQACAPQPSDPAQGIRAQVRTATYGGSVG
jgi:hypothetical protein